MSEINVIYETKNINTVESIYKGLLKLGINQGDTILIHSSLSSLGWTCGGEQAVIMALLQAVGEEGTLVMPSHSGDISDPAKWKNPPVPKQWIEQIYKNMPAFDLDFSPVRGMGRIASLFRTLPNAVRSNHPQVSFSAIGKNAKIITDNHVLTPQLGMNTPLGKLYELKAKVLLLGVGYDSCTSFHLAESLCDKMPKVTMGAAMIENNERVWKWFEDFDYDSDKDFEILGAHFDETGHVRIRRIGNAVCKIFDIKTGVDYAKDWLEKYRF
jgi:aminoglycoside 3-N-acetyltransferase